MMTIVLRLLPLFILILIQCKSNQEAPLVEKNATHGIYTLAQAASVSTLYARDCASCHGQTGRGTEGGSPLTGTLFISKWKDQHIASLYNVTKATMPKNKPASYDDETYTALIAFILQLNNYPPGDQVLSVDHKDWSQYVLGPAPAANVPYKYAPKKMDADLISVEGEWPQHRGDYYSTNYSQLDQINATTVHKLGILWRWKADNFGPNPEFNYQATPLSMNGILYTTAGSRRAVVAIDGRTGETLWTYTMNEGERTAYAPRQNSGRGVAYWKNKNGNDRVVYITPAYQLVALDVKTGSLVPSFGQKGIVDLRKELGAAPIESTIGSTSPPIIVNDVIIAGSCFPTGLAARSMKEMRGDISAYDAKTGKKLWIFHTIPQQGEFGNDTWEKDSWKNTGNVGAWPPLSADPDLGYVYLPLEAATGDLYGGHRPGDNLFSQSLVCLEVKTGKRVWHYQMIHHDIWDYDLPAPPVLADLVVAGRPIKAVAQVSKQGFVYVFDRENGRPIWPIEERPVPVSDVPEEQSALRNHSRPSLPLSTYKV